MAKKVDNEDTTTTSSTASSPTSRCSNAKNFLLFGVTGFIGKVLLERLLRDPEILCVYVIMRPKKMG